MPGDHGRAREDGKRKGLIPKERARAVARAMAVGRAKAKAREEKVFQR